MIEERLKTLKDLIINLDPKFALADFRRLF